MYVRNAQATVARALDSVVAQQYPRLQLVVVDGASTDGTLAVIERYRSVIDTLVSEPDSGPVEAANKCMARARGDIMLFLMADDWLEPDALAQIAEAFTQHPQAAIVSSGARIVEQAADGSYRTMMARNGCDNGLGLDVLLGVPMTAARYWRRELVQYLGLLDSRLPASHDRDWFMRAWLSGVESVTVDAILYTYLSHAGSTTLGGDDHAIVRFLREHVDVVPQWAAMTSDQMVLRRLFDWRREQLCEGLLMQLRRRDVAALVSWFWLAVRQEPSVLLMAAISAIRAGANKAFGNQG